MPIIDVIIPAFNEENSIQSVIRDIPKGLVREIIVINNNSNDATSTKAKSAGAFVLLETFQGYGAACLKGIDYISGNTIQPDIVIFIDADYSDYPHQMTDLVRPILEDDFDLVIGSRSLGKRDKGSMTLPQRFGTKLATMLLRILYNVSYTDLGPFRAIKFSSLMMLKMKDKTYGWTVEMQLKAAKQKMRVTEVPVDYRKRIGFSKISGTLKGTVMAGYKIISTIFRYL